MAPQCAGEGAGTGCCLSASAPACLPACLHACLPALQGSTASLTCACLAASAQHSSQPLYFCPPFLSFSSRFPPPQAEHDSAKVAFEEEKKRRPTPSKVAELVRSSDLSSECSSGGGPAGSCVLLRWADALCPVCCVCLPAASALPEQLAQLEPTTCPAPPCPIPAAVPPEQLAQFEIPEAERDFKGESDDRKGLLEHRWGVCVVHMHILCLHRALCFAPGILPCLLAECPQGSAGAQVGCTHTVSRLSRSLSHLPCLHSHKRLPAQWKSSCLRLCGINLESLTHSSPPPQPPSRLPVPLCARRQKLQARAKELEKAKQAFLEEARSKKFKESLAATGHKEMKVGWAASICLEAFGVWMSALVVAAHPAGMPGLSCVPVCGVHVDLSEIQSLICRLLIQLTPTCSPPLAGGGGCFPQG